MIKYSRKPNSQHAQCRHGEWCQARLYEIFLKVLENIYDDNNLFLSEIFLAFYKAQFKVL
jgi:hypothetical protein